MTVCTHSNFASLGCLAFVLTITGCTSPSPSYDTKRVVFNDSGAVANTSVESGGQVISELRRQFENQTLTGEGRIKNPNVGLARRAATQLAVAELAAKVESEVRANTRIYNANDIREVVETNVAALVRNYEIDHSDYEGEYYVVRVSMSGQRVVEEFERHIR